jgi:diguanylate cyclase (GGDEF)-like protein
MHKSWRLEIILSAFLLISIIAVIAEKQILKTTLTLDPRNLPVELMTDIDMGGNSSIDLKNTNPYEWHCTLRDKFPYPYCGLKILLTHDGIRGIDLRQYQKIKLWMDYHGPNESLRVYIRNYDPIYPKLATPATAKYNQMEFLSNQISDHKVEFLLSDFSVADWWRLKYKIPPQYGLPAFENIVEIEIETGAINPFGEHQFRLHKIELTGQYISTEKWYLTILIVWFFLLTIFLGNRFFKMRKLIEQQKKREQDLLGSNEFLEQRAKIFAQKAITDSLTQAFNREGLKQAFEIGLTEWLKEKKPFSIIMIDLDHFKNISDYHGHKVGDYVLTTLSNLVMSNIRTKDSFARWGGEEFVLICRDTSLTEAAEIAEGLRELIASHNFGEKLNVTASMGIATIRETETIEQLFTKVDRALYVAKVEGRNMVFVAKD